MGSESKTVLIFRTGQIGDMIVSLPALGFLRDEVEGIKTVLVTDERLSQSKASLHDFLSSTRLIDRRIEYQVPSVRSFFRKSGQYLKLAGQIRLLKPDALIYFSQDNQGPGSIFRASLFFRLLCGIRHAVGLEYYLKPGKKKGRLPTLKSEYRRHLETVAKFLGMERPKEGGFRYEPPRQDCAKIDELLSAMGVRPKEFIAVAVSSKMSAKKWPIENYGELIRRLLSERPNISVVLLGSEDEQKECEALRQNLNGYPVHNLAGRLSLIESAAVLKRALLYVGNDTGTMHLASVVGTRCVAIFSARDYPGLWDPWGGGHRILRSSVDCEGCLLVNCEKNNKKCLTQITVDEVLSEIKVAACGEERCSA